ncbi:hypothetical protein E2562_037054 [Oryza meyeriana var. granulata]|uniref:Uncharacterized protein n=1 Tax=Oryza meyeriana var. granulata TaxID=110450 RepID=A0A6G1ETJ6_9ORYZ|nr:hypothetical protein E2562_037054 [Oryza meyeriana var. granulata]
MWALRSLRRNLLRAASSPLRTSPGSLSAGCGSEAAVSNQAALLPPGAGGGCRRLMSTTKGRSMRSKVEKRMARETGRTQRELRRAVKLRKKLMTDDERLIYNLRRALFKARFEQALESQKLNIKKIETQLRRKGINPEDPVAMASIQRVASTFFRAIDEQQGTPYVFRGDIQPTAGTTEIKDPHDQQSEDSDQEELDRFIAEIESAAEQQWEEEEAAEKEESSRLRYWDREEGSERRGFNRSYDNPDNEYRDEGRYMRDNNRRTADSRRWDDSEIDVSGEDWDSDDDRGNVVGFDNGIDAPDEHPRRFESMRHEKGRSNRSQNYMSGGSRSSNEIPRNSATVSGRNVFRESEDDELDTEDDELWGSELKEERNLRAPKVNFSNYHSSSSSEEDTDNWNQDARTGNMKKNTDESWDSD